jgi:hypothetical protein
MNDTPERCFGMYDKWPDVLEVWRKDEGDIGRLKFVLLRKNNRMLQTDQMGLLRELEAHGLEVVVRVGTVELSLDQFEKGLGFAATSSNRMLAQSTLYNKRSELKRFELILEQMSESDSRRESVVQRITSLQEQLGINEPAASPEKVEQSAKELVNLSAVLIPDPRKMTEEELATNFPDISLMGMVFKAHSGVTDIVQSSEWVELLHKRTRGQNKLKEAQHAQQSVVTDTSDADLTAREESGTSSALKTPNES